MEKLRSAVLNNYLSVRGGVTSPTDVGMYLAVVFEVVAAPAADEALAVHVLLRLPLEVSQLGEGVHDYTEDDVHQDCDEDDEERDVKQHPSRVVPEVLMLCRNQNVLKRNERYHLFPYSFMRLLLAGSGI